MDVLSDKKCFSLDNLTSIFKDTSISAKPLTSSVADDVRYGERDALRAVKLDPAVLDAQVTVQKKQRQEQPNPTRSHSSLASDVEGPSSCSSPTASSSTAADRFQTLESENLEALRSISPEQLALLFRYVQTMRQQRRALHRTLVCTFCKNSGKPEYYYTSHALKDWRGRVLCPVLRAFRCPRCGATGDRAHTMKYCPGNNADQTRPQSRGYSF